MSKYTPGPWRVDGERNLVGLNGRTIRMNGVALPCGYVPKEDESIMNMFLASAAPELLDALEMALEWIDSVPSDNVLPVMPGFDRDYVDSIISKAKGEE